LIDRRIHDLKSFQHGKPVKPAQSDNAEVAELDGQFAIMQVFSRQDAVNRLCVDEPELIPGC
jgi:hypothetical protein